MLRSRRKAASVAHNARRQRLFAVVVIGVVAIVAMDLSRMALPSGIGRVNAQSTSSGSSLLTTRRMAQTSSPFAHIATVSDASSSVTTYNSATTQPLTARTKTKAKTSASTSSASWQSSTLRNNRGADNDNSIDLDEWPPTSFGPNGRLPHAHAALERASRTGNSVVVLVCQGGTAVVVVTTTAVASPYLQYNNDNGNTANESVNDTTTTTCSKNTTDHAPRVSLLLDDDGNNNHNNSLSRTTRAPFARWALCPTSVVWMATAGGQSAADTVVLRNDLANLARSVRTRHVGPLSTLTHTLARRAADDWQRRTQGTASSSSSSLPSVTTLVLSTTVNSPLKTTTTSGHFNQKNNNTNSTAIVSQLFRIDPTGQFYQCQATAAGRYAAEMERWLQEELSIQGSSDINQTDDRATLGRSSAWLRRAVADLSMDDALELATRCVAHAYGSSTTTGASARTRHTAFVGRGVPFDAVVVGGKLDQPTAVQSYTHRQLLDRFKRKEEEDTV